MFKELEAARGYLCSPEEKAKLQKGLWDDKGALNREIVVEETGIGKGFPFSAEKLSVTMTLYKSKELIKQVDLILATGEGRLVFYEEGRFSPGGFVHLACRQAYFETDEVRNQVLHFSSALSNEEREELQRACGSGL